LEGEIETRKKIYSDLHKIWDDDFEIGDFYKYKDRKFYYYVHNGYRIYSKMSMEYVARFSLLHESVNVLMPCDNPDHICEHKAYLPFVYDFVVLKEFNLRSKVLLQLENEIQNVSNMTPLSEDDWTERLAFGLQKNNISCKFTAPLRNRSVAKSWAHLLPDHVKAGVLVFQGAPDIIINKQDPLCRYKEDQPSEDQPSEPTEDDDNSQHSGRVQGAHQMTSLAPKGASWLQEKAGELVGALHTSLTCRAIERFSNGESVPTLSAHGLFVHRAHRVYHMCVTLSKSTLKIDSTLLTSGLLNERIICSIMQYYCHHRNDKVSDNDDDQV